MIMLNSQISKSFGLHADFSATGLHSNFARIDLLKQADVEERDIEIALLGSSMIGRLLPEFFSEEKEEILNLGMDGGGVNSSLELFLGSKVKAEIVVLELNGLGYEVLGQGEEAIKYADSEEVKLRSKLPALSYRTRPSDLLYTWLKRWKDAQGGGRKIKGRLKDNDIPLTQGEKDYLNEMVRRLLEKTDKVVFVEIPSRSVPNQFLGNLLSQRGSLVIRMADFPMEELRLTDDIHLNLQSAKKVAKYVTSQL